jgi:ATP-dependent DNA helicase PIF1
MRLSSNNLSAEMKFEIDAFSKWILAVGEGTISAKTKDTETEKSWIKIPHDILLMPEKDSLSSIVKTAYPGLQIRYADIEYLKQHAILCPPNEVVDVVNNHIVSLIPDDIKEYLSCDSIAKGPDTHASYDMLYPIEFLNSISGNNFPSHHMICYIQ